jgi:hypothetical protein
MAINAVSNVGSDPVTIEIYEANLVSQAWNLSQTLGSVKSQL